MELEKLNRRPWGRGRGKNSYKQRGREAYHNRLLNTENKLRVDGGRIKCIMSIEEGTGWDEHWVLYVSNEPRESTSPTRSTPYTPCVSQLDNKLYLKKKKGMCLF